MRHLWVLALLACSEAGSSPESKGARPSVGGTSPTGGATDEPSLPQFPTQPNTPPTPTQPNVPPQPDVFDPRTWTPDAKGLWIWRFDYSGKTAAEVATLAKEAGVGWVLIKSGQDERYWDTRYNAEAVAEFTSRGMRVFAWPYITLEDIDGSIAAAVQAANVPGTDGLILDVEIEWKVAGSGEQAIKLCDGIRAGKPGVFLGYTTFGWVGYHPDFPFTEFDQHCGDAFFPQVYWSDRGKPYQYCYDQAVQMIADAGLQAPVWIAQSNDKIYKGGEPTTEDLNAFFALSGPRSSLWVFPQQGEDAKVEQLKALDWANTP